MPRQYVIENGGNPGTWLNRIVRVGGMNCGTECRCFSPELEKAVVYGSKREALAIAKRCRGRVWRLKGGKPDAVVEEA